MQSVSSRIWTRVAVFISYDDNHYTTGTSKSESLIDCTGYRPLFVQQKSQKADNIFLSQSNAQQLYIRWKCIKNIDSKKNTAHCS